MVYDVLPETNLKVEDIRDTLNAYGGNVSNDVSTFFSVNAKIRPFSEKKPYRKAVDFTDSWESGFSSRFDSATNVTYLEYIPPRGGTVEPYRLGDFRGYKANAEPPAVGPQPTPFVLIDPAGQAVTGSIELVINNAKSIFKMFKNEFYTDSFRFKGISGTETTLNLEGSGESISLYRFTPSFGSVFANNPGVPNITTYVGELYQASKPDRCYELVDAPLELNTTVIVQAPIVSVNQQNLQAGLVHRVQSLFTFDTPAQSGEFFDENNIAFTWYSLNSDNTIRIYVVLRYILDTKYDFVNSTYVNNESGKYKLRAYAADTEDNGHIVKKADFASVNMSNSGKCTVRYWDVFDLDTYLSVNTGASWFGFDRTVYINYINDKPMVIIDTPIYANELKTGSNIVCVSISTT